MTVNVLVQLKISKLQSADYCVLRSEIERTSRGKSRVASTANYRNMLVPATQNLKISEVQSSHL